MPDNRRPIRTRDILYPNRILGNMIDDYISGAFTDYAIFFRAIVVQVDYVGGQLSGPTSPNKLRPSDWSNPKGSIVARIISKDRFKDVDELTVFWPMFPHDTMPIKEGEHVFVFFEDPNEENRGLWLCRIPEPLQDSAGTNIDNRNLVLGTDKFKSFKPTNMGLDQAVADTETAPAAITQSPTFTAETVHPFTARVGDRVIEGSNNTIIVLGTDRPADVASGLQSSQPGTGTVTIIAGRSKDEDIDLANDKSVVYISENTDGDTNMSTSSVGQAAPVGPTIIVKSDEIIIVAAKGMKVSVSGDLTIDGSTINIGNQAPSPAVLGDKLNDYLTNVVVNTPAGPGTLTPPTPAILSQTVKVKP